MCILFQAFYFRRAKVVMRGVRHLSQIVHYIFEQKPKITLTESFINPSIFYWFVLYWGLQGDGAPFLDVRTLLFVIIISSRCYRVTVNSFGPIKFAFWHHDSSGPYLWKTKKVKIIPLPFAVHSCLYLAVYHIYLDHWRAPSPPWAVCHTPEQGKNKTKQTLINETHTHTNTHTLTYMNTLTRE